MAEGPWTMPARSHGGNGFGHSQARVFVDSRGQEPGLLPPPRRELALADLLVTRGKGPSMGSVWVHQSHIT